MRVALAAGMWMAVGLALLVWGVADLVIIPHYILFDEIPAFTRVCTGGMLLVLGILLLTGAMPHTVEIWIVAIIFSSVLSILQLQFSLIVESMAALLPAVEVERLYIVPAYLAFLAPGILAVTGYDTYRRWWRARRR